MMHADSGYGGEKEEGAAGTAAMLPAEGGGAALSAATADLAALRGLGGLGPHAPGAQAARGGVNRGGEITLAEGDALVRVFDSLIVFTGERKLRRKKRNSHSRQCFFPKKKLQNRAPAST